MRAFPAFLLAAAVLAAGCSDDGSPSRTDCPDELGQDWEDNYQEYVEQQEENNATVADTDGDCVPDFLEQAAGSNPQDGNDFPDVANLTLEAGNATRPPYVVHGPGTGTVTSAVVVANGLPALTFSVEPGATLIFAEIRWDDAVQDLNLALASPNAPETQGIKEPEHIAEGGGPGMPDSPHSLTLSGGEVVAGSWEASAFATGVAVELSYEVVATVFYGPTSVPEGYTAFM